jgi:hypothetical protein
VALVEVALSFYANGRFRKSVSRQWWVIAKPLVFRKLSSQTRHRFKSCVVGMAYPSILRFGIRPLRCFLLATSYTTLPIGLAGIVFRIELLNIIPEVDCF